MWKLFTLVLLLAGPTFAQSNFNRGLIRGTIVPDATGRKVAGSQDFILDVRTIKNGRPAFIVGDVPPSPEPPAGYPAQRDWDTGLDLQYLVKGSYRDIDLAGTTINTNYGLFEDWATLKGNPSAGVGDKQIVGFFRGIETSSAAGDLANVADIKLANNYFSLRTPSFTGTMEGTEDDLYYRAAGTISNIQYGHLTSCGVPDAVTANITSTSYCSPTEFHVKGSGALGEVIQNDVRPIISMAPSGTLAGMVGYCFACVNTVTTTGTVNQNVYGFQANAPSTLPRFSANKYWFAGLVHNGSTSGATVNNFWFDGGDWNSGHLAFGGNGGSTATHFWVNSNGPMWKLHAAPSTSTDGYQAAGEIKYTHSSLDLASVTSGSCSAANVETVTGAARGDACVVSSQTGTDPGVFYICNVTNPNEVKWQLCNLSGVAEDRGTDSYNIRVIH